MSNLSNIGKIKIDTSNNQLIEAFNWSKEQALQYVRAGDSVGYWYEASLPGRDAFCMRDVSHQATGAQVLGLRYHTKNMLKKFAENISEKRDWCSYWEINKNNLPAPVDYKNDNDFWYNLPSNFDVLDCCLRQYLWTGDIDYIDDPIFLNFYKYTVDEFVKRWDINNDGIMEHKGECSYRGIPSYLEGQVGQYEILTACDMIASQYAGYLAYSKIENIKGNFENEREYTKRAEQIKSIFNTKWWDENNKNYYTFILKDGRYIGTSLSRASENCDMITPLPLYFGITENGYKTNSAIRILLEGKDINVETKSYYPEILYRYGYKEEAYRILKELSNPSLKRREYPEVSYSILGSIITGMMGIRPDSTKRIIETTPKLTDEVNWISINNIPVLEGEVTVSYVQNNEAILFNNSSEILYWKPVFQKDADEIIVNGVRTKAKKEIRLDGLRYSYTIIPVNGTEKLTAKVI